MGRLNRYIFKNAAISIGGLIVLACCVLLLERLLRIFEIVTNSTTPGSDATTMIVNLLPYYLGMAVPIALLLGTIITIDRLSKSSELTAAYGAGFSLFHITKPFILLAVFLSGITMFVEGYFQPVGRYKYRETLSLVNQQSFTAALREGKFTKVERITFFAGTEGENGEIGPIFIYEESDESGYSLTTAELGEINILEGSPILNLTNAQGFPISKKGIAGQMSASRSSISRPSEVEAYRARGDDEREMTSRELFDNRNGDKTQTIDKNTNNAMLHLRLSKAVLLLILPFIAVPFGLNYGRNPSSAGIFVGVVFLVSLQKALEFAQSIGAAGKIPPWSGIWGIILAVAIFAFVLFWKSAYKMGQPPLTSFSHWVGHLKGQLISKFEELTGKKPVKRDV